MNWPQIDSLPFLLSLLGILVLLALYPVARRRGQRERWADKGLCITCGYDIRASHERCPECGTPIDDSIYHNRTTKTRQAERIFGLSKLVVALTLVNWLFWVFMFGSEYSGHGPRGWLVRDLSVGMSTPLAILVLIAEWSGVAAFRNLGMSFTIAVLVVNGLAWGCGLAWLLRLPAAIVRVFVRSARHDEGYCIECGYDLRDSRGRCPQCGATIDRPSLDDPRH